jgi:hypothetical protein
LQRAFAIAQASCETYIDGHGTNLAGPRKKNSKTNRKDLTNLRAIPPRFRLE